MTPTLGACTGCCCPAGIKEKEGAATGWDANENAGVDVCGVPNSPPDIPPNAGAGVEAVAPNAGVLVGEGKLKPPVAGLAPNNEGVGAAPKAGVDAAPNNEVLEAAPNREAELAAPNAGVEAPAAIHKQ